MIARAALTLLAVAVASDFAFGAEPRGAAPGAFAAVVGDDVDVVLFPGARRPAPRPSVTVATRVHASPAAVGAVLLDPARYRAALPSLVHADVVATRPAADPTTGPERLLAWELEIPLFNLKGRAWLSRQRDVVELTLVEGAFAPGHVRFRVATAPDGKATILVSEVQVEARSANWIIRRVARHDPWAETALTAAAAWVVTRAVALEAESPPHKDVLPRPTAPIAAPLATALDGASLAGGAFASLRKAGVVAAVHRAPTGRLAWVSAAVAVSGAPEAVAQRVGTPESWQVFPGWKSIKRLPGQTANELRIAVEDNVAFVDLDATWRVTYGEPSVRATVVDGATRGAVLGWQTFPGVGAASSLTVLSMHPRIDATGYAARKMLATEPLLEHALALALTYADAAAVADLLGGAR
ncbi:MAG TPA: hypothetical protein VGP07_18160 [Polyangia bacterium]|jgi:hypothetical protein